ncbi:MAG: glycosyltransferase family 39 protein [Rhodobacteraceae bacterium]|nr:glycosyltransferase family 39 protein [Paracoccaceae bacterium]
MEGFRDKTWLGAILVLAVALRLWGLNAPMWHDEIQTLTTHVRLGWSDMVQSYSMNHHYLHNIAAKLSVSLFGEHPWSVRLPAFLAGIGTLVAMWYLARDVAGAKIAHVTTLLLALSYHQIWFSQNARGYTGLALFSTLGMLFFLRGIAAPRRGTWIAYGACLAAAVFTHLTGAFFFAAQGVVWLGLLAGRALRGQLTAQVVRLPFLGFLVGGLIAAVLYLPVLPSLIDTVGSVSQSSATDVMQEYQSPLWTAMEAIRTAIGHAGPLTAMVGALVVALSVLGAVAINRDAPLFAVITFAHIVLTAALLVAVGMRVWPRFFFVDIGFLMLLIVLGVQLCTSLIGHFLGGERVARGLFALAVIAMVVISAGLAKRNYDFPKQDLAGAYAFAKANGQGKRIYAIGYSGQDFRDYYGADWPILFTNEDYIAAMAEPGPVLLVVGFPERNFRDVPQLAADADAYGAANICAPDHTAPVLHTLRCFGGTLGDGNVIVFARD